MSESTLLLHRLQKGLEALALDIPCQPLLDYVNLLHKWNKSYNLTAIRDKESMVTRHVLDSLAVLPWVLGPRVLDVGSGAGLPGIPLALARPDWHVVLLDSNGKKVRFLQEVKRVLSLTNIEIVSSRVENYHPSLRFDTVISRAFSELGQMLHWTSHLLLKDGIWLAMKGKAPLAELASIEYPYRVEPYTVSGVDGARTCVIVSQRS